MSRLDTLLTMLEKDPADSFLRYALAKEYEQTGDISRAIEILEHLRSDDPQYVGLYYHLGKMYESEGTILKPLQIYEEGIRIAKAIPDFHALSELNNVKVNLEMLE
ncbi:MAG: hypothetical protein IPM26_07830 [Saprospiraceae bacterium]|nr:hypothetical protein [Saprospiraceae bacterium]